MTYSDKERAQNWDNYHNRGGRERKAAYYQANREQLLAKNAARYDIPDKPDGAIPGELLLLLRLTCLQHGRDPGRSVDVRLTMLELGNEFAWLSRGWFHPDRVVAISSAYARNWRTRAGVRAYALKIFNQSR